MAERSGGVREPAATGDRFARIPEAVLYDGRLSSLDVRVYGVLVRHADDETGECWPGLDRIAERVGATERGVRNSIRRLRTAGHIEVVRRGRTLTNLYRVTGTKRPITPRVTGTKRPSDRNETTPSDRNETTPKREPEEREPENENDARARRLCDQLADSIAERGSKRPTVTAAWLRDMDRLLRIDGRSEDEIAGVIRWLTAGADAVAAFWAPNVRSPRKLRERWDQMREQYNRRNGTGDRNRDTRTVEEKLAAGRARLRGDRR